MNDSPEKRIASSPIRQSPGSLAKLNDALATAQAVYPVIPKKHRADVVVIICRMSHSSGAWVECEYPVATLAGDGFNHQTLAGGVTFAKRYSYCAVTGAVAEETIDDAVEEDANDSKWRAEPEPEPKKAAASPPRRSPPKPAGIAGTVTTSTAARDGILADMARVTTPESLKQWHADNTDRIMAEGDEWRDGTFYPRYDDHMATLRAKA